MNRELDLQAKSVHEAIEIRIKAEGLKPKPVSPIEAPVLAEPHTAIYKMHRYYARRPHNVFSKLIQHYSDPGDLILDPFCGGGVSVVEALKLRRRVVGIDINPLATWITKVEVEPVNLDMYDNLYHKWVNNFEDKIKDLFKAICPKCGEEGIAEWFEWSNVVICCNCNNKIVLANAKKKGRGLFQCPNPKCKSLIEPNKCRIMNDEIVAVNVSCHTCGQSDKRETIPNDLKRYEYIKRAFSRIVREEALNIPSEPFPDMDRARDDNIFGKGIKYFNDLMTSRHLIACGYMKKYLPRAKESSPELQALWHLFSSSLRFFNKFVFQSSNWQGGNPVEWAGHNYWLPFHYLELNPLLYLGRRFKSFMAGKKEQELFIGDYCHFPKTPSPWKELQDGATCCILTQSSHKIKLPNESIDAIITDPPFGGNVQYGELSDFYLCWVKDFLGLDELSDKTVEAIETRHTGFDGAKDREFYENMLYRIFKECRRVIKPNGWMVMTFHNRDIGVWMSLHRAALRAGFRLPSENESQNRGMLYQPPVQHYTTTIHQRAAGSMLGDFILSFKPVEPPIQLESIKSQLSVDEEKSLQEKAAEIIHYHGGADETTLMTGLIPYLHERALLHRIIKYDLKSLLESGPFVYVPKQKKWYTKDMVEETGSIKMRDLIPAEVFVQNLIFSYLSENKQATMDDLLILIYSQLVNSHRPQMSTIENVLAKYCKRKKLRGTKREVFIWNPRIKTPDDIKHVSATQTAMQLDIVGVMDHNEIIKIIAENCLNSDYSVHIGETEQRKSPQLKSLSVKLSGLELGLPPEAFRLIREIDLIIFKGSSILAAIEVATSISTFNKAINDRFRNLLTIVPNLTIQLGVIIKKVDFEKAHSELFTPANMNSGLTQKVRLFDSGIVSEPSFLQRILGG